MSEKFTPGPWVISGDEIVLVGKVGKRHEEFVAGIYPTAGSYIGEITRLQSSNCINGIDSEETKANAHLIAAAPEMYEALQAILPYVPISSASEGGAVARSWNVIAADKVRAALKKARGES